MYYAVIHRPEVDLAPIEDINRQYNPTHGLSGPHVTLLFPVSDEQVSEAAVRANAERVAQATTPFQVRLNRLELSWDQWLFLTPTDGSAELNRLHDELYEAKFGQFLRKDIPFVPHVALGQFAVAGSDYSLQNPKAVPLDEDEYRKARSEVERAGLDLQYTATTLEVISVDDDFTRTTTLARYAFSGEHEGR